MKAWRGILIGVLILAMAAGMALAVPNFNAGNDNTCTGITITPAPGTTGTNFTYQVSIASNATFNGSPLIGAKGLFVYVNGGDSFATGPTSIVASLSGWDIDPYQAANGGFGFSTAAPVNYILPGQSNVTVGSATFTAPGPPNQVYLIHLVPTVGESGFCQITGGNGPVIPEPGTMALLGTGLIPMLGFLKRRRS